MQQEVESACSTSTASSVQQMSVSRTSAASEALSSVESLLVHSGNVASWNKLRRKGVLTSTDEVSTILFKPN